MALDDLARRLAATRLPEQQTVTDFSPGAPLKTIQQLLHHWRTSYDWRNAEARLNAVPNFTPKSTGWTSTSFHVRSKHENALPIIVTHGWPGSVVEQLKIIGALTDPTAHGGSASDAFHVVIPSIPGFGFSGKPTTPGWGPVRIAQAWTTLMKRLGYQHFVASGGDWGAVITDALGAQAPPELLGIHTNMPGAIPAEIDQAAAVGAPTPSGLTAEETSSYEHLVFIYKHVYYALWMATRPQSLTGFADSPVGPATFLLDHDASSLELIARARRADRRTDTGRYPRQRHVGAPLLGEHAALLQPQGRRSTHCRKRFPGRALPDAPQPGGTRLSQPHPLQQAGKGRPLRRLGTAEAPYRGASRGLRVAQESGLTL